MYYQIPNYSRVTEAVLPVTVNAPTSFRWDEEQNDIIPRAYITGTDVLDYESPKDEETQETSNSKIVQVDFNEVVKMYSYLNSDNNEAEVKDFLQENPDLLHVLQAAPSHIEKEFGKSELALEMTPSYDYPGESDLSLVILTSLKPAQSFLQMRKLYSWWLDLPLEIHEVMSIRAHSK